MITGNRRAIKEIVGPMLDRARHWLNMARECRAIARHAVSPPARAIFLEFALDCERHARLDERRHLLRRQERTGPPEKS